MKYKVCIVNERTDEPRYNEYNQVKFKGAVRVLVYDCFVNFDLILRNPADDATQNESNCHTLKNEEFLPKNCTTDSKIN